MNRERKNDLALFLFGLLLFAALQGGMESGLIGSFWKLNITLIGINIILSASLNLINGYTGQFSLGHAGFMAVGAYVGVVLTTNFHWPLLCAMAAAAISFSRMAMQARPWVEWTKFLMKKRVNSMVPNTQGNVVR